MKRCLIAVLAVTVAVVASAGESCFRPGSRVVFLGDSITHQGKYLRFVDEYLVNSRPGDRIRTYSAGVGGDRTDLCLGRLARDVDSRRPDVIAIMLGMNDCMNDEAATNYESNVTRLVARLKSANPRARFVWMTPSPYDSDVRLAQDRLGPHPERAERLRGYAEFLRRWRREQGGTLVDLNAAMEAFNRKAQELDPTFTLCGVDRVHPQDLGGYFMARIILRDLGLLSWTVPESVAALRADLADWRRRNDTQSGRIIADRAEREAEFRTLHMIRWQLETLQHRNADDMAALAALERSFNGERGHFQDRVRRYLKEWPRVRETEASLEAMWTDAYPPLRARAWPGFACGIGMGGWLTNYKRFNVLPEERRLPITEGDLEHFDSFITESDVTYVKSLGFDHIRLGFDQIVLEEAPYRYRERTFRKIDDFIGWCARHRLGVVLNLHKAIGNYCDIAEDTKLLDDAALQDRVIALWLEIERRYHDQPALAFELLNEVRNESPAKWNAFADRALCALREKNAGRWIVIGSTCWNSASTLKDLQVWDDPKVVYTFHMYNPYVFTHQRGVLQAGPLYYNRVMPYPTTDVERYREYNRQVDGNADGGYAGVTAIDRAYLKRLLQGAAEFVDRHPDKILWNGEFGTIRHAPPDARVAYMRDVVSICQEWGIPWCVWNYLSTPNDGNRFSLVDDDTRKFLSLELLNACLGK